MQVEYNLHKDLGLTFVMVTHDQRRRFCRDRIAVMNQGKIEQVVSEQIYEQPRTPFVADFIGIPTYFQVELKWRKAQVPNYHRNRAENCCNSLQLFLAYHNPGGVRPEKIHLSLSAPV